MKYLIALFFLSLYTIQAQEIILEEKFENGIPADWKIKSSVEKRSWYAKSFREMYYITMSAFGGKGKKGYDVKAELHTPLLDLKEKTCKLKFKFADAYQNGQPLQVYISGENLQPYKKLNEEDWKDLINNSRKYDNKYESTDWITLPKLGKPYRIGFVYESKRDDKIITTIIQLKEVDVWCQE